VFICGRWSSGWLNIPRPSDYVPDAGLLYVIFLLPCLQLASILLFICHGNAYEWSGRAISFLRFGLPIEQNTRSLKHSDNAQS